MYATYKFSAVEVFRVLIKFVDLQEVRQLASCVSSSRLQRCPEDVLQEKSSCSRRQAVASSPTGSS